jgi:hypothetical protein
MRKHVLLESHPSQFCAFLRLLGPLGQFLEVGFRTYSFRELDDRFGVQTRGYREFIGQVVSELTARIRGHGNYSIQPVPTDNCSPKYQLNEAAMGEEDLSLSSLPHVEDQRLFPNQVAVENADSAGAAKPPGLAEIELLALHFTLRKAKALPEITSPLTGFCGFEPEPRAFLS